MEETEGASQGEFVTKSFGSQSLQSPDSVIGESAGTPRLVHPATYSKTTSNIFGQYFPVSRNVFVSGL